MKIVSSPVCHPLQDTQAAEPEFFAGAGVRRRELLAREPISSRFQFDSLVQKGFLQLVKLDPRVQRAATMSIGRSVSPNRTFGWNSEVHRSIAQ